MKYSFIVPTYNSERWVQPCINGILSQTNPAFNLIILDSGSTDGTLAWIRSLNDSRIIIHTTETRQGIVENWKRIITIPRNEFMTIVGHDDIMYPGYLGMIDELIERFPGAGLYQTHFNFIDGKGNLIRASRPMKETITAADYLQGVLQHSIEITATGFMVRSADYDRIGGIPDYPNLLYADTELWLTLIRESYMAVAAGTGFAFRFHLDNTSKSPGEIRLKAFERMIDFFVELKSEKPIYKAIIEENAIPFLKHYVIGTFHKLLYLPPDKRGGATAERIIEVAKNCAQKLLPGAEFEPDSFPGIKLTRLIDSNIVSRSLFRFYKSFKKRTF